jgi:hypothetical protein
MPVKDYTILPLMASLELCTNHTSGFMGPDKASSHVTTSSNRIPCLKDVVGGGMRLRAQTSPMDRGRF